MSGGTYARLLTLLKSESISQSCSNRRHLAHGVVPPDDRSQRICISLAGVHDLGIWELYFGLPAGTACYASAPVD